VFLIYITEQNSVKNFLNKKSPRDFVKAGQNDNASTERKKRRPLYPWCSKPVSG